MVDGHRRRARTCCARCSTDARVRFGDFLKATVLLSAALGDAARRAHRDRHRRRTPTTPLIVRLRGWWVARGADRRRARAPRGDLAADRAAAGRRALADTRCPSSQPGAHARSTACGRC